LAIRNNLKQYGKGITTIIITHRISTARDADLIIVLEDGHVSEMGTHGQLVLIPGLYSRIAEIQGKMA
jgi:ATP-binding cassette subfamily B protein